MDHPRFLIIGRNGQVGWELCRALAPLGIVNAIDFPEIDLTNPDSIRHWIRKLAPRVIVNAAAYTAVDKAEAEPDRCHAINATAPGIIAEEAKMLGGTLVHYSTDYVFDGAKRTPYVEEDAPNPLGAYGRAKAAGDAAVQQVDSDHLIFRLCWVYGGRGQNFMLTIMRLAREREQLRVVQDQFGCPTWSRMIAEATALALGRTLADRGPRKGLFHLAAFGQATWHSFADAIVRLMPPESRRCKSVQPISTAEYPTPAKRPAYSVLSCEKLERNFGLKLPEWEISLKAVLEQAKP